ncbi:hypothetical protein X727_02585 [Mesorhizobium sp. L103C119B0]|nr:hypothetical protein X773_25840 [Mesorhizobium sp. LSJC285A00]ESX08491.1 hypothetical protein X768_22370 [Mesorhizobium sp. LSJC265A00]ESX29497.1 hypothetical protein X765_14745 [Mesorhizobium sp. LSHC440B00]ESY14987.1 hypothetical protein X750_29590 [Mesorhizobium sp. LNJC394B00]ESY31648.1 hypothetical protein X749_09300 [Mesorhizobium sp. LNJC391B00]ESY39640.1 hypothetical protein X747_22670 [Mesorhizobium sp. LNJC384A00]ESY56566.1 hypothetical protein X745_05650 [Mesorhizobium sp. LNJC3
MNVFGFPDDGHALDRIAEIPRFAVDLLLLDLVGDRGQQMGWMCWHYGSLTSRPSGR